MTARQYVFFLGMTDKVEIAHLVALHGVIVHEEYGCRQNNGNCSHVCLPSSYTSYVSMFCMRLKRTQGYAVIRQTFNECNANVYNWNIINMSTNT